MDDETIEALERLSRLKDQGVLSDEEFTEAKDNLLRHGSGGASLSREVQNRLARISPIVVFFLDTAPDVPEDESWVLLYAGGRLKGQGLSMSGVEQMTLYIAPPDLVILGRFSRELWRKSIVGMTVKKKGLDYVQFTAADGETVSYLTGPLDRTKLIQGFLYIQEVMTGE